MKGVDGFEAREWQILESIARDLPLDVILLELALLIESNDPDALCSILLLDAAGLHVRAGPAPRLPPAYVRALDGLAIGPQAGSCGAAAYSGQRVIVEDISTHPYWQEYRALALSFGLRACWSTPILSSSGAVLGTFAIYYETSRAPEQQEIEWVDAVTHLASIAIVRTRSQQALQESEQRLRAVIEHTPDVAVQWYDAEGRLLFLNDASVRILGLPTGAVGQTLRELGFWADSEEARFRKVLADAAAGARVEPTNFQFRRPDGSDGFLLSTVFGIPHPTLGTCSVCMDVELTELVRSQEELARLRRMASVGRLASGIAHDFNNILGAILANAELAHSDSPGGADCDHHLAEIELACRRGARLVDRVLTFSPSEPPRSESVDLASVVSEVVSLLSATLPPQVVLQVHLQDEPHLVHADSTQIHQVLMNLISNAKHALLPKGGTVQISSSRFRVSPQPAESISDLNEGPYWRIDVADDGTGMDEVTLQRAFDPFFTTKKPGEGTGLGLSVAHGVMVAHHGAIRASSRLGQGARFSLYFPEQT